MTTIGLRESDIPKECGHISLTRPRHRVSIANMNRDVLTTSQAAARLSVQPRTVQRMVTTGEIVPWLTLAKGHLFEPTEVERVRAARDDRESA